MSSPSSSQTIFFLGGTGYLGSQFLLLMNEKLPKFHVIALLQGVPRLINFVESLDDGAIIQEQVVNVDIVIDYVSSDHFPGVKGTCSGAVWRRIRNSDDLATSDPRRALYKLENDPGTVSSAITPEVNLSNMSGNGQTYVWT
ncbi:hypothetical protein JVU11DRAFT_8577 [Chiua virens]|nr:hypothetical protein JVU11DRAFT_8577 [Chiua virens]